MPCGIKAWYNKIHSRLSLKIDKILSFPAGSPK